MPRAAAVLALLLIALAPLPTGGATEEACDLGGLEPARFWTYDVTRHHNATLNTTTRVQVELVDTVPTEHGPALQFIRTEYGAAYTARMTELRLAEDLSLVSSVANHTWESEQGPGWSETRLKYDPPLPYAPCRLAPEAGGTTQGRIGLTSSVTAGGDTTGPHQATLDYERNQKVLRAEALEVPAGAFDAHVVRTADIGGTGRSEQWTAFNATVGLPLEEQTRDRAGALREHWQLVAWGRRAPDLHVVDGSLAAAPRGDGWIVRLVVANAGDGDADAFTLRVRNATGGLLAEVEAPRPVRARTALDLSLALPAASANETLVAALEDVRPTDVAPADNQRPFRLGTAANRTRDAGRLTLPPEAVDLYPGAGGAPGLRLVVHNAGDGDVESFHVTVARPGETPFLAAAGEYMWANRSVEMDLPLEGLGRPRPSALRVAVLAGEDRVLHEELEVPWTLREEPPATTPPPAPATPPSTNEPAPGAGNASDDPEGPRVGEPPAGHGAPARPMGPDPAAGAADTPAPAVAGLLAGLAAAAGARRRRD